MKYLYKNRGVVVESSLVLDSSIFTPYTEPVQKVKPEEKTEAPPNKTTQKKVTAKKTTGRTTTRSRKG